MIKNLRLSRGVLEYEFARKKVKNINLRVRADGSVYVSAPKSVPIKVVEGFIRSKTDFIFDAIERTKGFDEPQYEAGDRVCIFGAQYTVMIVSGSKNKAEISGGLLVLALKDPSDAEVRIKTAKRFLDMTARRELAAALDRVFPLFARYNIEYPTLYFRSAKTRWGSCCAAKKRVMLNTRLISYPLCAAEYVAAHELAHLIEQNHSAAFYSVLSSVMPDYKTRRALLKG